MDPPPVTGILTLGLSRSRIGSILLCKDLVPSAAISLTVNRFAVNAITLHANGPPTADNMLVNGTMVSDFGGSYSVTTLSPNKTHLLRLMNNGVNNWVNVGLDGHPFTVIASDFNPIVPYTTNSLTIAVGKFYLLVSFR